MTEALRLQLHACREAADLTGIVLSDEDGVCIASSGDEVTCEEIAARLPLVGRKVKDFEGILFSPWKGVEVRMRRFHVDGAELYMAAIGSTKSQRDLQLNRSIGGVARILQAA